MNTRSGFNSTEDFQACQQYAYNAYYRVHPDEEPKPPEQQLLGIESIAKRKAAAFGTAWHAGCEAYDKTADPDMLFRGWEAAWAAEVEKHENLDADTEDMTQLARKGTMEYLLEFANQPLEQLGSEVEFALPMVDDMDPSVIWTYTGKRDRDVRYNGVICYLERKTTSDSPAQYLPQYALHRGLTGYIWSMRQQFPNERICGALLEVAGKPRSKSGNFWFRRELVLRADDEIDLWYREQCAIFRSLQRRLDKKEPWVRNTRWCENWAGFHMTCNFKSICQGGSQATINELIRGSYRARELR